MLQIRAFFLLAAKAVFRNLTIAAAANLQLIFIKRPPHKTDSRSLLGNLNDKSYFSLNYHTPGSLRYIQLITRTRARFGCFPAGRAYGGWTKTEGCWRDAYEQDACHGAHRTRDYLSYQRSAASIRFLTGTLRKTIMVTK